MRVNYYNKHRERFYKNLKPIILIEDLLVQEDFTALIDYKFYCFGGRPLYVLVIENERNKKTFFDENWNEILENSRSFSKKSNFRQPTNFQFMKEVAASLSRDFPFVRVDLYSINEKVFFGELTFTPHGGVRDIHIDNLNHVFGDLIQLPKPI